VITAASPLDKTALRAKARSVRAVCAAADPGAADRAAASLAPGALPSFTVVAGYWPKGSELSPLPLMRRLAMGGAELALPAAQGRASALTFRRWAEGDPLAPDAFGIPAPGPAAPQVRPDLIIAPVLAFDSAGSRLGQGAGHYDRTLEALRAGGPVFVVGLAFAGQEVDRLPQEPHDQRLDAILTEDGYRRVGI